MTKGGAVRLKMSVLVVGLVLMAGCQTGTAQRELAQLRERVATLEAENAHLKGQASIIEFERTQLREQVNELTAEAAKLKSTRAPDTPGAVAAGQNLVVMPNQVYPGSWVSVYIRNLPTRLLRHSGVALRTTAGSNVAVYNLAEANVLLLTVPKDARPGTYKVVLGQKGLPAGARIDDAVAISVLAP